MALGVGEKLKISATGGVRIAATSGLGSTDLRSGGVSRSLSATHGHEWQKPAGASTAEPQQHPLSVAPGWGKAMGATITPSISESPKANADQRAKFAPKTRTRTNIRHFLVMRPDARPKVGADRYPASRFCRQ
jgi:hypothetical protein